MRDVLVWSGAATPVVDAIVVSGESVSDAPQDGLGAAGHLDLAVDGADVGLDGVRAKESRGGDLGVAFALGDQREYLGFPVSEPFVSAGPVLADGRTGSTGRVADHDLAGMHCLERFDKFAGGKGLGQVAVHAVPSCVGDQVGMEVPGVDDDPFGVRAA